MSGYSIVSVVSVCLVLAGYVVPGFLGLAMVLVALASEKRR
jgi:hypothetical protein